MSRLYLFVKLQARQFAARERHVIQCCFCKPCVAQIAIGKRAVNKTEIREIGLGKIATNEFADFVVGGR